MFSRLSVFADGYDDAPLLPRAIAPAGCLLMIFAPTLALCCLAARLPFSLRPPPRLSLFTPPLSFSASLMLRCRYLRCRGRFLLSPRHFRFTLDMPMLPPFYADADLIFHAAVIFSRILHAILPCAIAALRAMPRSCALLLRRFHFVC
jgi:hypothetical protein